MGQTQTATLVDGRDARPSVAELVERAEALVPTLRERATLAEKLRRIPDETLRDFKDAGFVRMATPERFGGYGYDLADVVEVIQPFGRACGASAWMGCFWPTHQFMVGWYSEEAQAEYWADGPDTISSTAAAVVAWESEQVDGGIRVTGSHKLSSGIDHAEWVLMTSPNESCLVPRSDFEIVDDWHVSGLKGTGSKSIRYENIFIPSHRIITHEQFATDAHPGKEIYPDNPMYQISSPPALVLPNMILASVIAMAGGVLDRFDQRVRTRRDTATMEPAMERQLVQHHFAESSVEHDIALMLLRRNLQELAKNSRPELLDRARMRRDTTYANHLCVRLVDRLTSTGDSSAIYDVNQIHRLARDVRTGALQVVLLWDEMAVQYSRVCWGMPPHTRLI
jgi:3-hydroxy-9,10-secoandrosta-1,3,5(10)-triene-9,17-dione monooxygenase